MPISLTQCIIIITITVIITSIIISVVTRWR
jgi:hypothetical protein